MIYNAAPFNWLPTSYMLVIPDQRDRYGWPSQHAALRPALMPVALATISLLKEILLHQQS